MLVEILTIFHNHWAKPTVRLSTSEIEQIRRDNWQRCNHLYRDLLFIMIMSAIEHRAKVAIEYYDYHPVAINLRNHKKDYLYLRDIMRNSKNILITENAYEDWSNLIDIRNCVVHNNVISKENGTMKIGDLIVIEKKDEMIQGKMDFFLSLSEISIDRYYEWVISLINKCS